MLDLLTTLVAKSLVQFEAGEGGGYRLLETVRQYARDRLVESGEGGVVRGRHLACFLALAEEAEAELQGPNQKEWLDRLEREHENLWAALAYCLADRDDAETPIRFAGALARFWSLRGYPTEGLEVLAAVLERMAAHQPTRERAKALNAAGRLAHLQGDLQAVRAYCEEALAIARALNDATNGAAARYGLAEVARDQGDYESARTLYEQSLAIWQEVGDRRGISNVLYGLGMVSLALGDYAAARERLERSIAMRRELGDQAGGRYHLAMCILGQGDASRARVLLEESGRVGREYGNAQTVAWAVFGLADVALAEGDHSAARAYLEQSLVVFREQGDRVGIAGSLERFAALAVDDQPERAARLYAAAQTLREALGVLLTPAQSAQFDRNVGSLRASLGQEGFAAECAVGRAMPVQQAIDHALQEGDPS